MLQKTEPIKILIAPDSFKECLPAKEVAKHIEIGVKKACPNANTTCLPIADGGEGSIEAILDFIKGKIIKTITNDPLNRKIESRFALSKDKKIAVIEVADIIGLNLLKKHERNPLTTSTYGVGKVIKEVLNYKCKEIIIAIGGTATNDCGAGMLSALGIKFYNKNNEVITFLNGGNLIQINRIDTSKLIPELIDIKITVACDVKNPLTGVNGTSLVYAPQKGADVTNTLLLDNNLKYFAKLIKQYLHKEVEKIPYAGAAGGLGAGLFAFLNAELYSGFEVISKTINLENTIKNSDLIITGEGKIDGQTLFGKTPFGVAQLAKKHNKPLIALCGTLGKDTDILYQYGFHLLLPIKTTSMPLSDAIKNAPSLLEQGAEKAVYSVQNKKTS